MLNGEIRSRIDALWNAFWTGGISNPLEVIEQITYLLFLKRLDDLHGKIDSLAGSISEVGEKLNTALAHLSTLTAPKPDEPQTQAEPKA